MRRTLRLIVFLLLCATAGAWGAPATPEQARILIINSYHDGYKGSDDLVAGFRAVVRQQLSKAETTVEYLDFKRFPDPQYREKTLQLLRAKYRTQRYDLIYATDDDAFDLLLSEGETLFPDTPKVFAGTNFIDSSRLKTGGALIGIDERPSFREGLQQVGLLMPKAQQLVVIHDTTLTGRLNSAAFREAVAKEAPPYRLIYLAGQPLEDLLEQVARLSPTSAVFYFASVVHDRNGTRYTSNDALHLITKACPAPIFGGWEFNLGHGIVGGKLVNLYQHGLLAGQRAVALLNGTPAALLPLVSPSPNQYMYDARQLERFSIPIAKLPKGSVLINRKPHLLEQYRTPILIAIISLLAAALIAGYFRLLASRRRLAQALDEQQQTSLALQTKTEELDRFFTRSLDLFCVASSDGRFIRMNPEWERTLGYPIAQLEGASIFNLLPDNEHPPFQQALEQLRRQEPVMGLAVRMRTRQGKTIWLEWRTAPYGDIFYAVARDITAKLQYELELEQAREAAEAANRSKSDFLATMSHEIRTPLNGVIGMAQLLGYSSLNEEQRNYLNLIASSADNLLTLINDILDLSKIEAEKVELETSVFSLRRCIAELTATQQSRIHAKGLHLQVELSDDTPDALIGDQLRIKQILLNLLSNAIKFTEQGRITIQARLLEQQADTGIFALSVEDSGIGIPPELQEKVFFPFSQAAASTSRLYGGTGLGLTICRKLAGLLGGSITLTSAPGQGSRFCLTIPLTLSSEEPAQQRPLDTAPPAWDGPSLKILLADDNQVNLSCGAQLLTRLGHRVTIAHDGKEARMRWEEEPFDLLLLDIQMPDTTGDELLRLIRSREQLTGTHLPVIAITALGLAGDRERFLKLGFDGYIAKPYRAYQLADTMTACLKNR